MARCAARNADSVARHLASDVSRVFRLPSFFIHAACITSSFDVSYPSTISAIMSWTNWYLPIGCPKVSRSRAYSTDRSRQARVTPHAPAATVNRPWSRPYIAISKPWPSSPTRFSAGTATFSKAASPRSISSQESASATKSRPAPPYSSGITIPRSPSSAIPSITDLSRRWAMSLSIALGSTRSLTNVLTVSWMSRCSSVSSKSTGQVYGRAAALGPFLLPLALVGGVALDNGGFDATAWGWSTLLPLVIVGTALVLGRARPPHGLARAFLGLLGAFTAWTWLSAAWSNDVSASVLDAERLLLYFSAAAVFLLLERGQLTRFLVGLLAGISLAGVWALSLRSFGGPGSYDVPP